MERWSTLQSTVLTVLLESADFESMVERVLEVFASTFVAKTAVMWDVRVQPPRPVAPGESSGRAIAEPSVDSFDRIPRLSAGVLSLAIPHDGRTSWVLELHDGDLLTIEPALQAHLVELARLIGLMLGRTERAAVLEAELRASQAKLARLEASDVIAFMITTTDGRIIDANNALLRLLGLQRADLDAGRLRWDSITPPEWAHTDARAIQQLVRDGVAPAWHKEYLRSDGTRVPVILGAASLGGDPHQSIVFVVDITAQKQVEHALETLNVDLEERVAKRSESLRELAVRLQTVREEQLADLAREIHDVFGQDISVLQFDVAWLSRRLGEPTLDVQQLAGRVGDISQRLQSLHATVRRIAGQLRPRILDDLGLVAAIETHARDLARSTGITIELALPDEIPLEPDLMTAVYRIYQELMTNVVRHARASRVEVSIVQTAHELLLLCVDDGVGIADDVAPTQSLGLLGIRERALAYNGHFEIGGTPKGTVAALRIPLVKVSR